MNDPNFSCNTVPTSLENISLNIGGLNVDIEIHSPKYSRHTTELGNQSGWIPHKQWGLIIERTLSAVLLTELDIDTVSHIPDCELSIVLSNNNSVQQYNRDYRSKDKPTNILSFPGIDDQELEIFLSSLKQQVSRPPFMLGDLIIAYETIDSEALAQNKPLTDHFTHLVTHGLLHLLGYDHINDEDAEIMENRERQILSTLNIRDPYVDYTHGINSD
jgi:rRNA maturation RNase YbeY